MCYCLVFGFVLDTSTEKEAFWQTNERHYVESTAFFPLMNLMTSLKCISDVWIYNNKTRLVMIFNSASQYLLFVVFPIDKIVFL